MNLQDVKRLVESTSDAAFASDTAGEIIAWNKGSEVLFGLPAKEAIGKFCGQILRGADECGPVCSANCSIQQAVLNHHPVGNFDLQIQTKQGLQWSNISILIADAQNSSRPYSIHILRKVDIRKRLELLIRDFIVNETELSAEEATAMMSCNRAPARETELTERELNVLRLLAKGMSSDRIANQLHISRTTVNNHVQHILRKFNVHTRLEAVRRAELAGFLKC